MWRGTVGRRSGVETKYIAKLLQGPEMITSRTSGERFGNLLCKMGGRQQPLHKDWMVKTVKGTVLGAYEEL